MSNLNVRAARHTSAAVTPGRDEEARGASTRVNTRVRGHDIVLCVTADSYRDRGNLIVRRDTRARARYTTLLRTDNTAEGVYF